MMKQIVFILPTVAALALIPSTAQSLPDLQPNCAANPYGLDGKLSQQDLNDLFYVGFPQSVVDMRGRFGSPLCLDDVAAYYQVDGTNNFIAVDYNGAAATGWRAWGIQP